MPYQLARAVKSLPHRRTITTAIALGGMLVLSSLLVAQQLKEYISGIKWPEVKVVDPGPAGRAAQRCHCAV